MVPANFVGAILYEDNHLLVVNKRALVATMGAAEGEASLVEEARHYLKEKYRKPGNVYLGVVSRLDAWVTGAVVLARTSKAASRLSDQFRRGSVTKVYWALLAAPLPKPRGIWVDHLRKNEAQHRMEICEAGQGQRAELRYQVLESRAAATLVEVELVTGRKHQIRLQFTARGWPIIGDRKYGSRTGFPCGIALHSRSLSFQHPVRQERLTLLAPLPDAWRSYGEQLSVLRSLEPAP